MASTIVPFMPEGTLTGAPGFIVPGRAYDIGDFRDLEIVMTIRGVTGTGTPTLGVAIEHSIDMVTWLPLVSFPPATTPANDTLSASKFLRYVRAVATGSTGAGEITVTFSVFGIAKD